MRDMVPFAQIRSQIACKLNTVTEGSMHVQGSKSEQKFYFTSVSDWLSVSADICYPISVIGILAKIPYCIKCIRATLLCTGG